MDYWSRRELDAQSRSRGETGWTFGYDALSLRDQLAYLGELVAYLVGRTGELLGNDETSDRRERTNLRQRINREAFELSHLVTFGAGNHLTREDCLNAEAAYEAHMIMLRTDADRARAESDRERNDAR